MSKARWLLYGVAGICAATLAVAGGGVAYLSWILPSAGPPPEVHIEATPEVLARGAYLVEHVATCLVCHSEHDVAEIGAPISAADLGAGGPPFGPDNGVQGTVYAPNITPARLADWSDGELIHALTTGVTPDHVALHPVMPWRHYAHTARPDLEAMVAYLRTLPAVDRDTPPRELEPPFDVVINLWPTAANPPLTPPDPSDRVATGAYLAELAGCEDCHTPVIPDTTPGALRYAGGVQFVVPGRGIVRSSNLTPDAQFGLGQTRDEFIQGFRYHLDDPLRGQRLPDGVPTTVMPWAAYAGMTEADLGAIYDFLQTLPPVSRKVERFTVDPSSPPRDFANMPRPVPPPEGMPTRGALGTLCDTLRALGADANAVLAAEPDARIVAESLRRTELRGHSGGVELWQALAAQPEEGRRAWLAAALDHHDLNERCPPY